MPQKLIHSLTSHLESLGYKQATVKMIPLCVSEFLEIQNINQVRNITSTDIVNHHEYLQNRPHKKKPGGLSESYINHHIYSLRIFFSWLLKQELITVCPISNLEFKSPTAKQREVLTIKEVKELYKATQTPLERAILSLFYGCGLRRSEAVSYTHLTLPTTPYV